MFTGRILQMEATGKNRTSLLHQPINHHPQQKHLICITITALCWHIRGHDNYFKKYSSCNMHLTRDSTQSACGLYWLHRGIFASTKEFVCLLTLPFLFVSFAQYVKFLFTAFNDTLCKLRPWARKEYIRATFVNISGTAGNWMKKSH